MNTYISTLIERTLLFAKEVQEIPFTFDGYIYNPLQYAWEAHRQYLTRYVHQGAPVLFLGMNPGPFGMVQTGVPFGEITAVRDWMGIRSAVGKPPREHPARPVVGFDIQRSEISGKRLWTLMQHRFGTAERFFSTHTVMNYCPLVFVDPGKGGKNVIPEKLPKGERQALEQLCDSYLDDVITLIAPKALVGIGLYAKQKLTSCVKRNSLELPVVSIMHPSPGNPLAHEGWDERVTQQLVVSGIW